MENEYEQRAQQLLQEIAQLEIEKEELERDISNQCGECLTNVLSAMEGGRGRSHRDTSKLLEDIERLERSLAWETKLNGITLTECYVKTTERDQIQVVQEQRLKGHCHHLSFQVEFEIVERRIEDTLTCKVRSLNIVVDGSEFKDISAVMSRVEDTKNLQLFFKILRCYSECFKQRQKTFQHFKDKYPDMISIPGGSESEVMLIQRPALKGCAVCIVWDIGVTGEGEIKPKLDLLLKTPEEAMKMDSRNIVENAPWYFQNLLRVLGAEASIDSVIMSVCM